MTTRKIKELDIPVDRQIGIYTVKMTFSTPSPSLVFVQLTDQDGKELWKTVISKSSEEFTAEFSHANLTKLILNRFESNPYSVTSHIFELYWTTPMWKSVSDPYWEPDHVKVDYEAQNLTPGDTYYGQLCVEGSCVLGTEVSSINPVGVIDIPPPISYSLENKVVDIELWNKTKSILVDSVTKTVPVFGILITFYSDPVNAIIYIGGELIGKAMLTYSLSRGEYPIKFGGIAGYDDLVGTIKVTATGVSCVDVVSGTCASSIPPGIVATALYLTGYMKLAVGDICSYVDAAGGCSAVALPHFQAALYSHIDRGELITPGYGLGFKASLADFQAIMYCHIDRKSLVPPDIITKCGW